MKTTKHSDLIFDVGLHKGEDSEYYLKKGFRVVAFEADPNLAQLCRQRLASYLATGQLTIVEGAVVDEAVLRSGRETITFYTSDFSVCGTLHPKWVDRNAIGGAHASTIEVKVVDFAKCLETYGVPYYLKIDIEGSDLYCLHALVGSAVKPDYVSIETEHDDPAQLREEIALFEKLGYDRFIALQQDGIEKSRPPSPAREGVYVPHCFSDAASGLFGRELPGTWMGRDEVVKKLEKFIADRRFWGGRGLQRNWLGQRIHGVIKRLLRRPLPGWYDTHAKHSSVKN